MKWLLVILISCQLRSGHSQKFKSLNLNSNLEKIDINVHLLHSLFPNVEGEKSAPLLRSSISNHEIIGPLSRSKAFHNRKVENFHLNDALATCREFVEWCNGGFKLICAPWKFTIARVLKQEYEKVPINEIWKVI